MDSFEPLRIKRVEETSLTLLHEKSFINPEKPIRLDPMEIKTFKVSF